jgi:hypothetical protein
MGDLAGSPAATVDGRCLIQAVWTLGFARRLYPRLEMALHNRRGFGITAYLPSKTIKPVDIYESAQYCRRLYPFARQIAGRGWTNAHEKRKIWS